MAHPATGTRALTDDELEAWANAQLLAGVNAEMIRARIALARLLGRDPGAPPPSARAVLHFARRERQARGITVAPGWGGR
jgi:hypothetical protein